MEFSVIIIGMPIIGFMILMAIFVPKSSPTKGRRRFTNGSDSTYYGDNHLDNYGLTPDHKHRNHLSDDNNCACDQGDCTDSGWSDSGGGGCD